MLDRAGADLNKWFSLTTLSFFHFTILQSSINLLNCFKQSHYFCLNLGKLGNCSKTNLMFLFFPLKNKKKTEQEPKGEVKNHNHTASTTVILSKANLQSLEFVLLPLFLILHLAHFDFQARKLCH